MNAASDARTAHERWNLSSALKQIESCDFECIGGPLENNAAFRWLAQRVAVGPKFMPGQTVYRKASADVDGAKLESWIAYTVVGCSMGSDTERVTWTYSISRDPPAPWRYGKVHGTNIGEHLLFESVPEDAPND